MSIRSSLSPRVAGLGVCAMLALFVIPSDSAAQQPLSPVEIAAERSENANARADTLEEWARALYSTPSRFREAAQLHHRAAIARGDDPRAAASYRTAALIYSAAHNNGLATKLMLKAGERAALAGRVEDAANYYVDAAFLAVEDNREDKVAAILSRMHTVLNAPLLSEDQRLNILRRVQGDARVARVDAGRQVAP